MVSAVVAAVPSRFAGDEADEVPSGARLKPGDRRAKSDA